MDFGEAGFWMKKAEKILYKKTGKRMVCGTLNIEIDKNYNLEGNLEIIHKEEYGGDQEVYIKECEVLGHKSYIIRTDKNMSENFDHPYNILEIISDVNFREMYKLQDGDTIKIIIK